MKSLFITGLMMVRNIAVRFAIAFPLCLYAYASAYVAISCIHNWTNFCIELIVVAPILLIFGPLAHDVEDPPNHYPPIILGATVVVAIWTLIACIRKRRKNHRSDAPQ